MPLTQKFDNVLLSNIQMARMGQQYVGRFGQNPELFTPGQETLDLCHRGAETLPHGDDPLAFEFETGARHGTGILLSLRGTGKEQAAFIDAWRKQTENR